LITLPQEIDAIQSLMQPGEQIYLVGGAVRDALLTKPNQDLDFVCADDPRLMGRKLAEKLSGAFYVLDDERNACRVISKNAQGRRLVFDFTQLRGQTLQDDLLERDFTINAIAVDLRKPDEIIDPLNGTKDLLGKCLRPCKSTAFRDDPLRIIRAIRYSIKYGFEIEQTTIYLMNHVNDALALVSKERKRDELFKIFEIENPRDVFELFVKYDLLKHVCLNSIPDIYRAISRLSFFTKMSTYLKNEDSSESIIDLKINLFASIFSDQRIFLQARFDQVNQSERSIHALDNLITLLWDLDEVEGVKISEGLALSKEEQEQISLSLRYKCCILDHFASHKTPDRKFIYRYFQSLGIAGVDLAILSLIEAAITSSSEWIEDQWKDLLLFCQRLIVTWFEHPDHVNPKLFLTGRDLMFEFDIPQGPRIGQLIDGLREEQAVGLIQNRTQALAWVDEQIQKGFIKG
jgi:tRNA nucleotidyltransferase/poly(A) polymerase